MKELDSILTEASTAINACDKPHDLNQIKAQFLGKKSKLNEILKGLGKLSADERPKVGDAVNHTKQAIMELINQQMAQIQERQLAQQLATEKLDVSLPGIGMERGSLHPVTQSWQRIEDFFSQLGFIICDGPEIETEYYNFDALNIPSHHPARAMHDTFYVTEDTLLRTHTSPVQIRHMKEHQPPFRMIAPGRVYRCDSDVTHTPMFHQMEGLLVDEHSSLADLKGILEDFMAYYFQRKVPIRFRPSYFPFTEPSAEADIQCVHCDGKGCRVCSHTGWLEVLGCGMVHPNVLIAGGINADRYSGFAFGVGIDRLTMLLYGIDDLRLLFDNDIRMLEQF